MENELKVFTNSEFGSVRTIMMDGEPYFVGKDVAEILGYGNPRDALSKHVDDEDKGVAKCDTLGGTQELTVINESGLYSLILSSKLPTAKKFKRWVTSEVLPSIRGNGVYATDDFITRSIADPEWAINLLTEYKASREKVKKLTETVAVQTQQIAELQPKATYYDTVLSCKDALPISVIAKDYGWSAKQMNRFLNDKGVQYKLNGTWLLYSKYADRGYTKTVTYAYDTYDGDAHANVFTKWTQAGRLFIYELMTAAGYPPLMERELPD